MHKTKQIVTLSPFFPAALLFFIRTSDWKIAKMFWGCSWKMSRGSFEFCECLNWIRIRKMWRSGQSFRLSILLSHWVLLWEGSVGRLPPRERVMCVTVTSLGIHERTMCMSLFPAGTTVHARRSVMAQCGRSTRSTTCSGGTSPRTPDLQLSTSAVTWNT